MSLSEQIAGVVKEIRASAAREGKTTGFAIGNTAKQELETKFEQLYQTLRDQSPNKEAVD